MNITAEELRLEQDARREKNWKRWGPYLSERQWGTVREDYSEHGECWDYFPHDHARSRAYRWGEDGLLGITDRECRLCFCLALWNGKDPILKERLFGLTGPEGNHGEDVKEAYFYLDSTPTHSYMKGLYKYPQAEYPYRRLVEEARRRGLNDPEFELEDTGVFADNRYFDVLAEYAKADAEDILIRITVANRGPEAASLHLLPTLWFRNNWSWGCRHEGCDVKPLIQRSGQGVLARQRTLGGFRFDAESLDAGSGAGPGGTPEWLFTENETNMQRIFGTPGESLYSKDGFHERVVNGRVDAVEPAEIGTKTAAWYRLEVPAGGEVSVRLRLRPEAMAAAAAEPAFGAEFDREFAARQREADEFFAARVPPHATEEEARVMRQGYAGLLWSKQFYHYVVQDWLEGDSAQPSPPEARKHGRNSDWGHLYNRDVISMPDKWEYPWYAAWDLAFHMIPFARIDPEFAKGQLELFLREWYMHPNGQIPAYEFAFGDVNPPVHAWSVWRVYKMTGARGGRDRRFLESAFQKLLLNFTWWVNRKDVEGKNLFSGGFLGLDNIGVFDRSRPLPGGGHLEQADGTAWMAFYCSTMLAISLKLARQNPVYEDLASKFFEHFVRISDAMNTLGGTGLWDDEDGFYYDQLHTEQGQMKLKVRSIVGLIPLFACEILDDAALDGLPGFKKRMDWFLRNRRDLAGHISYMESDKGHGHRLLAIPTRDKLERVLGYMLDENEFLSPYGIRSVSKLHGEHPYILRVDGQEHRVDYVPGESNTGLFGGNSNWRGPIWFPLNYLLIEALERYHHFYGDELRVEFPTGSGRLMNLKEVAGELASRLASIFLTDATGARPFAGGSRLLSQDSRDRELVLFHEYFHGETGRGVGASHQTGWTSLAVRCIEDRARARAGTAGRKREKLAQQAPVSR